MKVMYLLDCYNSPYSGAESQLLKLINELLAQGHEVEMTALRPSLYLDEHDFPCPVEILNVTRMLSFSAFFRLAKFAYACKKRGFGIVHILLNDAAIFAPPVLKAFGLKVIVSRLDMGFWYTSINLKILRITRFFVDRVLANGIAVKKVVMQREHYSDSKVQVIYNGLELADRASLVPVDLNECLGFAKSDVVVGIVASLYPIKRIEDLISAIASLKQRIPNIRMISVGGGDASRYQQQVTDLQLDQHVFFVGPQKNPLNWIRSFDVAVLCSESEGFSNALVEYLHCGVPVVCSDVGGNPELVSPGLNGELFPMGDVEALAMALQKIIGDSNYRNQLAQKACETIDDRFSISHFVQAHLNLYEDVL